MNTQAFADPLDQYGPLLNARELARLFGLTEGQFYKRAKLGDFERFKVDPPMGQRCYSKALITRYLNGERIDEPSRTFGRKRAR